MPTADTSKWYAKARVTVANGPRVKLLIFADKWDTTLVVTATGLDYDNLYDAGGVNNDPITPDHVAITVKTPTAG